MVFGYAIKQAAEWIADFFRHWYADGFRAFVKVFMRLLANLDRALAFRVSVKNLFKPMYQDRTFIEYIMGFIFRSIRIITALIMYTILGATFIVFYTIWAIVPPYLLAKALNINDYSIL